jgi:ribonuclease G
MNKEMIISSTSHETRVAILEDDHVVEVFIEREHSRGVVGNIYKGRVSKVLPGMQSAFVDLGLERDAFLYGTDVISPSEEELEDDDVPSAQAVDGEGAEPAADSSELVADETEGEPGAEEPAAADGGIGGAPAAVRNRSDRRNRPERTAPTARIEDLLKEGQEVVVQVVKEPLGTKGARITSHLSLPGRFLVYMPTVDHIGVSRKIESRDDCGGYLWNMVHGKKTNGNLEYNYCWCYGYSNRIFFIRPYHNQVVSSATDGSEQS